MSLEEEYNRVKRKLAEIIGDSYSDRSMWPLLARVEKHISAAEQRAVEAERRAEEAETEYVVMFQRLKAAEADRAGKMEVITALEQYVREVEADRDRLRDQMTGFEGLSTVCLTVLCAARDGQTWHENMLKDFDCAINGCRALLADMGKGDGG